MPLRALIEQVSTALARANLFFGHGTDNAVDEAHWLVLHCLGLAVDEPVADDSIIVEADRVVEINALLKRRIEERLPLAYLLESAWFAGLEFYVDERVLVPRSPIATLVLDGFRDWFDPYQVDRVLDLCTGSGCIAIACSYALPAARVTASDLSADALEVARINIAKHQADDRIQLCRSDVFAEIDGSFDLIVSNPPYVDAHEMAALHPEYQKEPALGLAAGVDGLAIVEQILAQAANYLSDDGVLIVEVGNSAPQLEARYPNLPFLWLDFGEADSGIFVLTAAELRGAHKR